MFNESCFYIHIMFLSMITILILYVTCSFSLDHLPPLMAHFFPIPTPRWKRQTSICLKGGSPNMNQPVSHSGINLWVNQSYNLIHGQVCPAYSTTELQQDGPRRLSRLFESIIVLTSFAKVGPVKHTGSETSNR